MTNCPNCGMPLSEIGSHILKTPNGDLHGVPCGSIHSTVLLEAIRAGLLHSKPNLKPPRILYSPPGDPIVSPDMASLPLVDFAKENGSYTVSAKFVYENRPLSFDELADKGDALTVAISPIVIETLPLKKHWR